MFDFGKMKQAYEAEREELLSVDYINPGVDL